MAITGNNKQRWKLRWEVTTTYLIGTWKLKYSCWCRETRTSIKTKKLTLIHFDITHRLALKTDETRKKYLEQQSKMVVLWDHEEGSRRESHKVKEAELRFIEAKVYVPFRKIVLFPWKVTRNRGTKISTDPKTTKTKRETFHLHKTVSIPWAFCNTVRTKGFSTSMAIPGISVMYYWVL